MCTEVGGKATEYTGKKIFSDNFLGGNRGNPLWAVSRGLWLLWAEQFLTGVELGENSSKLNRVNMSTRDITHLFFGNTQTFRPLWPPSIHPLQTNYVHSGLAYGPRGFLPLRSFRISALGTSFEEI
jgi:hypothetical protein